MSHKIDLSKYQLRTDLAIEAIEQVKEEKIKSSTKQVDDMTVTEVVVDKHHSDIIGKKVGIYKTIEFNDITDYANKERLKTLFAKELKELLESAGIKPTDQCLIVGLGNDKATADALGPMAVDQIIVTKHLFQLAHVEEGFRNVAAINPGVMGETGIETSELIKSVIKTTKPDFVIAIDALASQSLERVNHTIQMTDTGIHPGSGVGNARKELSKETLKIPVIAVGVPTVVDAVTIVSDTINYMYQHFSYTKEHIDDPAYRLITGGVDYRKKEVNVHSEDKQFLFGILGGLQDHEVKQLLFEVLSPIGYNLIVTPKEVDFIMEKLSDVVGNGINRAIHENVDH